MKGRTTNQDKQVRIQSILGTLSTAKESGKDVSLRKFTAEVALNFGLTTKKVQEYIRTLENAGRIVTLAEADLIKITAQGENAPN